MSRLAIRSVGVLLAVLVTTAGILGAVGYGRDYDLHRGFATVEPLRRAGTGHLEDVHFYSAALHRQADYLVYLPPGYTARRRYPTYYLLHGMPGQPKVFIDIANMDVRLDNQMSLGRARRMILVFPDGRIGGSTFSDSEWANTPSGHFESYVMEVVQNVDQRFSALPARQDRVIAGFSAGGFGAMNIALHHLDAFANVEVWSGYYTETRTGVFAHASRATLAYNSPIDFVRRLGGAIARDPLRVEMFVGRDDDSARQQPGMVRTLRAEGARVTSALYPGGHDWGVWYPRLNGMIDLASADVAHPLRAKPRSAAGRRMGSRAGMPRTEPTSGLATARPPGSPEGNLGHAVRAARTPPHATSGWRLIAALLIALLSAALINIGFVLQHHGRRRAGERGRADLSGAFSEPIWLVGQTIGWIGFAGSVFALAVAPLTLVQAFAVGSLAISVPLAAWVLGARIARRQLAAVIVIALSLISLPIGFGAGHDARPLPGVLVGAAVAALFLALLLQRTQRPAVLAAAGGILYGLADAAIKADAHAVRHVGLAGLASGWTALAALATFGGFLAFQSALRHREAVLPLTLMNAFTAITATVLGVAAFHERLGSDPATSAAHVVAIALVLGCIRPLLAAQQRLSADGSSQPTTATRAPAGAEREAEVEHQQAWQERIRRAGLACTRTALLAGAAILACLSGIGLLYGLRSASLLGFGPRVPDALPLLTLAGFAGQPLARVLVAFTLAGLCLRAVPRFRRSGATHSAGSEATHAAESGAARLLVITAVAALVLLASSDASFALADNLRLGGVLLDHEPGLGPWLEFLLLAGAAAAPPPVRRAAALQSARSASRGKRPSFRPRLGRRALEPGPAVRSRLTVALSGMFAATAAATVVILVSGSAQAERSRRVTVQLAPRLQARIGRETGGRLETVDFYSRGLHHRADYLVYLPAGLRPDRRLPAFYLLHGTPGKPLAFTVNANIEVRLEHLIAQRRAVPMILVFPDGRIHERTRSDSEWANTPSGRYETYVRNVVNDVDRRFGALDCRGERAIGGLSEGGYGAMNIGLHELGAFSLIQSWSGYYLETHNGVFARADRRTMAYDSPIDYVRGITARLRRLPLHVVLFAGSRDPYHRQVDGMAAALRARGADVFSAVYPGGHNWHLWDAHVDAMLIDASQDFEHSAGSNRVHACASRSEGLPAPR